MAESGEAVEGLIPKIQEGLNKYTKGSVSVIDKQNGGLHSTYEILEQLSKVYPTLTDEAKAYINELIAGNRQNKVLVAIMENWNNVESATESAMKSLGSAARENEIYLNSIQGKLAQFQSTAQKLWYNTIDSSSIKSIVDFGTGVLKVVDAFGLLNTSIIVATTALLLFNKGFLAFYNANIASLFSGLSEIIQYKLVASLGMGKAAAIGLAGAINLIAPMAVIAGIMLLIKGMKWLSEAHERQAEKVRELKEEYDGLAQSLKETEEKQKAVADRLKELITLRDSNKITQAEKDELTRLENVNAELERQVDYQNTLKAIRGAELEEESLRLSSQKTEKSKDKYSIGNILGGSIASLFASDMTVDEKAQESIGTINEYTNAIEELNKAYDNDEISAEKYKKKLDELTKSRKDSIIELDNLIKRLEEENTKYNDGTKEGTARRESNELIIASAQDMITALGAEDVEIQKLIASFRDVKKETEDFGDSQSKLAEKIREAQEEFSKYGDSTKTLQTALSELSGGDLSTATLDKLVGAYKELIPYLDDRATLQEKINELIEKEQQKSYADSLKESTSTLQSLNELQDKLNKSQGVSAEVMNDVINKHSELAPYLNDRAALESAISDAIITQEDIQRQALTNQLAYSQKFYNEKIKGTVQAYNKIFTAYGEDINNFKNTAEAKEAIDRILVEGIGNRWAKMYTGTAASLAKTLSAMGREMGKLIVSGDYAGASSLSKQIKSLSSMVGVLRSIETQYSQTVGKINLNGINLKGIKGGSVGGSSSSSKAAQEIYKPIIDAYQKISTELDRINALLEENSILTDQAEGSDKIALLQKRIALIKQQENALKRLNVQQEKELQVVKNSLKGMGFKFDSSNNLTNYAQRLSKLTGDTAKSAEELIDRFVELSTQAIPDTSNEILKLKNNIKDIGVEIDTYITDTFDQFYNFLFHNIDEEIKKLEESKAKAREVAEAKIALIQAEIDQMQERNEAQKVEEERTKRLMDLAKQRDKLANVQNNRDTMLYNADGTASLVANPQKVRDETEKLMDLEEDYYKWEEDIRNQEQIKKLQDQIATLQDELKNQEKGYDDQISALQKFMEEQKDILSGANDFQIANAKALMKALAGIDSELYAGRLEALNEFVNSYNSLMGNTVSGNAKIPKITPPKTTPTPKPSTPSTPTPSPSPSPTPSSGSSSGGKVSEVKGSLKKGAKGENVKLLQQALVGLGYSLPKYGIDGSFGAETQAAVMQFQKDMGLVVDGSVGAKTKAKFRIKGYDSGGINDTPGMYALHGTKSKPEAIFNTKQLNNLFRLLDNFKLPSFDNLNLAGIGLSASGSMSNIYNISVGEIKTNDAMGLMDNLKNLVNKR